MVFYLLLEIWAKISLKTSIKFWYRQKLLDHEKQFATNPHKTASKQAIQNAAGATGNLVGSKITY